MEWWKLICVMPVINTRKVLNELRKGREVFVSTVGGDYFPSRVSKVLEETKHGVLMELEHVNSNSGELTRTTRFFAVKGTGRHNIDFDRFHPYDMTEILEETKYGLIINFEGNDRAFLSFQRAIKERLLPENPTPEDYRKLKKLVNDFISEHRGREKPPKDEPWVKKVFKEKIEHEFELRLAFLTDTTRGFVLRNPEQKHIYEAVRSNRREVTKADLDLPPPTSMEAQFAKQGYKPEHYTDGIDQVNEWAAVRKKLQELKANPYKTHIEYFADQVTDHIEHIKKGLRDYDHRDVKNEGLRIRDKEKQLGELAILEEEAKQAVSDKTVTYRWWLDFNLRLTSVMSGDAANRSRVDNQLFCCCSIPFKYDNT